MRVSGGTNLLGCEAGLAGEVTTASTTCWRRANQCASQQLISEVRFFRLFGYQHNTGFFLFKGKYFGIAPHYGGRK
jgi:hypothetical protein